MADMSKLEDLLRYDPGNRGLARHLQVGDLAAAAGELVLSGHTAIATGFFIPRAGNIESDGPPGAAFLARALESLGKQVTIICPEAGTPALHACRESLGLKYTVHDLSPGMVAPALLDELKLDAFIALEYCGQGHDGYCRNMRGIDITEHVPVLDDVLESAKAGGLVTIAIGDGGNELGCGRAGAMIPATGGLTISSRSNAEYVLCSGISNWGAYVLVAALSVLTKRVLLPTAAEEFNLLEVLCGVGVVDGVTGVCEATVDGVPISMSEKFLSDLWSVTEGLLAE